MTDARTIAAGLSAEERDVTLPDWLRAQAAALRIAIEGGDYIAPHSKSIGQACSHMSGRAAEMSGCLLMVSDDRGLVFHLTPLGREVAAVLQEQKG